MPPQKSTKAIYFTARFNPGTSDEDAKTVEIINGLIEQKYNFKQIAEDAILKCAGYTPEMFSRSAPIDWMSRVETMLTQFQAEILTEIRKGGYAQPSQDEDADVSPFSKNFAKKFMQRQQRAGVDEE